MKRVGMIVAAVIAAAGCKKALPVAEPAPATSAPAAAEPADPWVFVPGQSIGHIALGMTEAEVEHALSKPTARLVGHNLVVMVWLGGPVAADSPIAQPSEPMWGSARETASAILVGGKVAQIEVSSPIWHDASKQLSAAHTVAELEAARPAHYATMQDTLANVDDTASAPASKHIFGIDDDVAGGLAFAYGDWGNLSPDIDTSFQPEAIIVHAPGQKALVNPINHLPYGGHTAKSLSYRLP